MIVHPSEFPGSYERQLLRKVDNPLFESLSTAWDDALLLEAQRLDHEVRLSFEKVFHSLVQQAAELPDNVESDVILQLKQRLDHAYEMASALSGDQTEEKAAITHLLNILMGAILRGAGDDAQALQELEQERLAREAHFHLLASNLVADLLTPDSVISAAELVPTLLSAEAQDASLAVQLFDLPQLEILHQQGVELLGRLEEKSLHSSLQPEDKLLIIHRLIDIMRNTTQ